MIYDLFSFKVFKLETKSLINFSFLDFSFSYNSYINPNSNFASSLIILV